MNSEVSHTKQFLHELGHSTLAINIQRGNFCALYEGVAYALNTEQEVWKIGLKHVKVNGAPFQENRGCITLPIDCIYSVYLQQSNGQQHEITLKLKQCIEREEQRIHRNFYYQHHMKQSQHPNYYAHPYYQYHQQQHAHPHHQQQHQPAAPVMPLNPLPDLDDQHEQLMVTISTETVDLGDLDQAAESLEDLLNADISSDKVDVWSLNQVVELEEQYSAQSKNEPVMAMAVPDNTNNDEVKVVGKLDQDIRTIESYISAVNLPHDKLAIYKAQLDRLRAAKWSINQHKVQQTEADHDAVRALNFDADCFTEIDPFGAIDDVLADHVDQVQVEAQAQSEQHSHSPQQQQIVDESTSTYFGFVCGNNECADFKKAPNEVRIELSGYKFHGGNKIDVVEKGSIHCITHCGSRSGQSGEQAKEPRKYASYRDYENCAEAGDWNTCYGSFFVRSVHKNKICIKINKLNKTESSYGICIGIVDSDKYENQFHFGDKNCYGFRSDGIQYCNGKLVGKWDEYGAGDELTLLIYNNTIKWMVNNVIKCIQYNIVPSRKYKLAISLCGKDNSVSILSASKIENAETVLKKKKKNKKKKKKQKKKKKRKRLQELKRKLVEIESCLPEEIVRGIEDDDDTHKTDEDEDDFDDDVDVDDNAEIVEIAELSDNDGFCGKMQFQLHRQAEELRNRIKLLQKKPIGGAKKVPRIKYEINDKVRLKNENIGIIKFAHKTFFSNNQLIYGVELCQWSPNGHDGSYEDIQYFTCPKGHGFFAKADFIECRIEEEDIGHKVEKKEESPKDMTVEKIEAMIAEGTPPDFGEAKDKDLNVNAYTLCDVQFGNRVLLTNGLAGSVRFVGKVDFDDAVWIGIDLKKKNCNGHNAQINGLQYFECKVNCGYFIRLNEIERVLPSKSQKAKNKKKIKSQSSASNVSLTPICDRAANHILHPLSNANTNQHNL